MNRAFLRDLVLVPLAIAAIVVAALALSSRAPAGGGGGARAAPAASRDPVALGAHLFDAKGCVACHSADGTPRVGPSLLHDYGSQIALADGTTVAMDEAYIRESLRYPQAKARAGYPPSMPSFDGIVSERETRALVAYIRSLR